MSYSKCSNWRRILKLSSNFGCLFTFCYVDGANSIKTDLHICNLWIGQFVSYVQVCNLVFGKFAQAEYHQKVKKHPNFDANFDIRLQLEHFEYDMNRTLEVQ